MKRAKKASALLLSLAITASVPGLSSVKAEDYKLGNQVNLYTSADEARDGINSRGSYSIGTYNVYKRYNGMINISRVAGSLEEQVFEAIKEKIEKAKEEKEVIDNTKFTRGLIEKYIDSVFCEGNEVLNIIWK